MRQIIGIACVAVLLVGCGTITTKRDSEPTYREKVKKDAEDCVIRLMREGMMQQLIYPVCRDIHKDLEFYVPGQ